VVHDLACAPIEHEEVAPLSPMATSARVESPTLPSKSAGIIPGSVSCVPLGTS
jgi:hypothetical protein